MPLYEPLITNDRGRREWQWLCDTVGPNQARAAIRKLNGGQKPYPLNIARILGLRMPDEANLPPLRSAPDRDKAHTKISEIRALLR